MLIIVSDYLLFTISYVLCIFIIYLLTIGYM